MGRVGLLPHMRLWYKHLQYMERTRSRGCFPKGALLHICDGDMRKFRHSQLQASIMAYGYIVLHNLILGMA